jgi:transposase-like protein
VSRRAGNGALLPEARSFDDKFDAVGASSAERAEDLRKRSQHQRNLLQKASKRQQKKEPSKRQRRPRRYRCGVHTDNGPIALQAFWRMHVEAMNFSGMGHAEYAAASGLSPHSLRIWRDSLEQYGNEMHWRSLLHPSARAQISSAANCARRKYRLTPQEADGRSNRRRFSDEQKRAMVLETEKPGVAVAEVCRRYGIATSLLFRWRVRLRLAVRKTPQLATVILADGTLNQVPRLARCGIWRGRQTG